MKWVAVGLGLMIVATSSGCWRPYYGYQYGQPAYSQAPAFQQPQVVPSQPQVIQSQPAMVQQPVYQQQPMAQGCPPVYCQPQPQACVPCY